MTQNIRILIVDDHPVVREGLHSMLSSEPGLEVVGEAADGLEAIQKARLLQPDVILLDLVMPHKDGIAVTEYIKRKYLHMRVLILTSYADDDQILAAIKAKADGYLLKGSDPDMLLQAIRSVHDGYVWLHPVVARKVVQELNQPSKLSLDKAPSLTIRELEVLRQVAQGLSNRRCVSTLAIS
jgi:DNA-binding NarL/FixJ family response regulator